MYQRISARISAVSPSLTLAITAKAKAMKAAGEDVVSFGVGEPDFPTPAHIVDAAKRDYRLAAGSPGKGAATDGSDLGARDMPGLDGDQSLR